MRWRVRCPLPHCSEEISQDSDNLLSPESKERIWLTLRNAYGKHFAAVHASEFPMEKYPEAIPDIELKVDNGTIFKSVDQGRGRPDTKEATATMLGNCKRLKRTQPDRALQCGVQLINQVKGPESVPVSALSNRRPGQGGSHSSSFEEDDDPLSTFFAPSSSRKPPVETREEEKKSLRQSMEQATSAHHQRLQQMDQFFKKAEGPSTPPVSRADLVKCSSGSRMGIESKRREPAVETEEIESPVETPKKKRKKEQSWPDSKEQATPGSSKAAASPTPPISRARLVGCSSDDRMDYETEQRESQVETHKEENNFLPRSMERAASASSKAAAPATTPVPRADAVYHISHDRTGIESKQRVLAADTHKNKPSQPKPKGQAASASSKAAASSTLFRVQKVSAGRPQPPPDQAEEQLTPKANPVERPTHRHQHQCLLNNQAQTTISAPPASHSKLSPPKLSPPSPKLSPPKPSAAAPPPLAATPAPIPMTSASPAAAPSPPAQAPCETQPLTKKQAVSAPPPTLTVPPASKAAAPPPTSAAPPTSAPQTPPTTAAPASPPPVHRPNIKKTKTRRSGKNDGHDAPRSAPTIEDVYCEVLGCKKLESNLLGLVQAQVQCHITWEPAIPAPSPDVAPPLLPSRSQLRLFPDIPFQTCFSDCPSLQLPSLSGSIALPVHCHRYEEEPTCPTPPPPTPEPGDWQEDSPPATPPSPQDSSDVTQVREAAAAPPMPPPPSPPRE